MSTSARIAVFNQDGQIESAYCHCDGYPSHTGIVLLRHFNSLEKALDLVSKGNISSISPDGKVDYMGEPGRTHKNLNEMARYLEQYNYLFNGEEWVLFDGAFDNRVMGIGITLPKGCADQGKGV